MVVVGSLDAMEVITPETDEIQGGALVVGDILVRRMGFGCRNFTICSD